MAQLFSLHMVEQLSVPPRHTPSPRLMWKATASTNADSILRVQLSEIITLTFLRLAFSTN